MNIPIIPNIPAKAVGAGIGNPNRLNKMPQLNPTKNAFINSILKYSRIQKLFLYSKVYL